MLTIRPYRESDAESVGRLIVDTYSEFNLSFASSEERAKLLGPFRHAWSVEPAHREAIAQVIRPRWFSSPRKMARSSVCCAAARNGWRACSSGEIAIGGDRAATGRTIRAGVYPPGRDGHPGRRDALRDPLLHRPGIPETTGVRNGWSFGGIGLRYQPMKKVLEGR